MALLIEQKVELCYHNGASPGLNLTVDGHVLALLVLQLVQDLMAQGTTVLHVQPLPQAYGVEEVLTPGDLGRAHLLVADGADVVVPAKLLDLGLGQRVDLVDRVAAFHEHVPAGFRLAPAKKCFINVSSSLRIVASIVASINE